MPNRRAVPLTSPVRHYAWGSHTVLPSLLGEPVPAADPWAEIWIGAHPLAPSHLPDGRSLAEVEPALPFLVKLIAAEEPLSIQAHPDLGQARAGYADEQARGVPLLAAERSYKDANHKPELLVALERTHALCGFRSPAAIAEMADRLGAPGWSALVAPARRTIDPARALQEIFVTLLGLPGPDASDLVDEVAQACGRAVSGGPAEPDDDAAGWVVSLNSKRPRDVGALAPLLLDLVVIEPGEALFVDSGVLHAYLHGVGVEVQASSDNVLRGGLTDKHVDVAGLARVVRFEAGSARVARARPLAPGLDTYEVAIADFAVWRARPAGRTVSVPARGPCLAVCVQGQVDVCGTVLAPGRGAYVPATPGEVVVAGTGTCFVAAPGTGPAGVGLRPQPG